MRVLRNVKVSMTAKEGQGLELALCRRLLEAQGGAITVKSKFGRGSAFIVQMPARQK
jgi:signal transduction histidine kinase